MIDQHLLQFAKDWETLINLAVARRMQAVGVPNSMIGIFGMPYEDSGAFVLTHALGGSNNKIPGRGIIGDRPGINVDLAVLDPNFSPMRKLTSWSKSGSSPPDRHQDGPGN